jgi:hypothetical protein
MLLNSETFASKLRELLFKLESLDTEQAEFDFIDALAWLERLSVAPANSHGIAPQKVQTTMIALSQARRAMDNNNLNRAIESTKGALEEWERV